MEKMTADDKYAIILPPGVSAEDLDGILFGPPKPREPNRAQRRAAARGKRCSLTTTPPPWVWLLAEQRHSEALLEANKRLAGGL